MVRALYRESFLHHIILLSDPRLCTIWMLAEKRLATKLQSRGWTGFFILSVAPGERGHCYSFNMFWQILNRPMQCLVGFCSSTTVIKFIQITRKQVLSCLFVAMTPPVRLKLSHPKPHAQSPLNLDSSEDGIG